MKNTKKYNFIFALLILAFFAFGCGLSNSKAEENNDMTTSPIETESPEKLDSAKNKSDEITISSVVGKYDYDTEKDGEGFDNSLEVTKADDGKLFIYISGSYIYKVGETQTMKEAEGNGDAVLKGNTADATLVDEAGKPCRATIIFNSNTADVKIPDSCRFNISLDGVYTKVGGKSEKPQKSENKKLTQVKYENMMDSINDFDAHKVGEELIITDVPSEIINQKNRADEFGNTSYRGLYYLQGVTDDDTPSYSVLTSKAMIESLDKEAEYEPVIIKMTVVIAESKGKFDIYRMPFATKIEGFNSEGDVIWTALGAKPVKLNFTH